MHWTVDEWKGCYPSNWKGMVVDEAMTHPAKFSNKLIRRIYEHLRSEGWVQPGDTILDPFAGVALGALDALRLGLRWRGVELEPKFHKIGTENIALWNSRYNGMPNWSGSAVLYQGDSRRLLEVVGNRITAEGIVSSPPYKNETEGGGLNVDKPASFRGVLKDGSLGMGESEGNLSRMDDGNFTVALSSPPFRQSEGGTPEPKPGGVIDKRLYARHAAGNSAAYGYGKSDGQLANMEEGDFTAAVSSPPYENTDLTYAKNGLVHNGEHYERPYMEGQADKTYGESQGQMAGADNFWLAARQVVEQVYLALRPGGHAFWVVKDFVKNKERVPFCDQWRQVCEAVGFQTLHEHHALLVHGKQMKMDGSVHHHESKSFFRRVAEKKGSPRIDFEVVYCMVKPAPPQPSPNSSNLGRES